MFRYVLQRSLTYLVMVFITTTMGYFAAVITLQPALLEQEKNSQADSRTDST